MRHGTTIEIGSAEHSLIDIVILNMKHIVTTDDLLPPNFSTTLNYLQVT